MSAFSEPATPPCQREIEQINEQIEELTVQKQHHLDLAAQYQRDGDRWQYSTGSIEDAHQLWGKAATERGVAIELQLKIDHLMAKRDRIYQFYPELWP